MKWEPFSGGVGARRQGRFIVLVVCCVVGAALLLWVFSDREPENRGKRLSEWLRMYGRARSLLPGNVDEARKAWEAVQNIGTNGVPFLLEWISYNPPAWRGRVYRILAKYPGLSIGFNKFFASREPDPLLALAGFQILGERGSNAVPGLERLIRDPRTPPLTSVLAIQALGCMGKPALPALISALDNPCQSNRSVVVGSIVELGSNAAPAVPRLVECLHNKDLSVATMAASALGSLALEPDLAVPPLASVFQDTNSRLRIVSALSLGNFGQRARPAEAALAGGFADPDPVIRAVALNMLREIELDVWDRVAGGGMAQ